MSEKIPKITSSELLRIIRKLGFILDRQSGSHAIYFHSSTRKRVIIPMHSKTIIKPKTLSGILDDLGINIKRLKELL